MIFANPLGLLALLAIPVIIGIHLFRRRFPPRQIAGLFLWQTIQATPEGGGKIVKPPVTLSLILECLAALALALILAGARLSAGAVSQHLVVLLDDSASMAAVNARGESARDRALQRILDELAQLGAGARITLVQSGARPAVLLGPAALAGDARTALERWTPEAAGHSLALGLRLAQELAGQTGRLMVLSDALPAAHADVRFEHGLWVSVGEPLENVGIVEAHRTVASDGGSVISLALSNVASAPAKRRLSLTAGDQEILVRALEVPAGLSSLTVPIPAGLPLVRVSLSDDALARDNAVVLAEPRPQIVAVENHLPEGRGREALFKALDAVTGVTRAEAGHLSFGDASAIGSAQRPGVWHVGFGRPPAAWATPGASDDFVGPFVLEKRHPLLAGVTLGGVVWTGAAPIAGGAVRPLISAGNQVLMGIATPSSSGSDPAILVNLDLDRTNLIRAPDWPILISNIVELRRQNLPGPERWNYRVGEWVRLRLGRDPTAPLRARSGGTERPLPASGAIELVAPSPGGSLEILEGEHVLFALGVNFLDPGETDLRARAAGEAGQLAPAAGLFAESGPSSDPLFWVLLSIAAGAIVANWCLLPTGRVAA